MEISQSIQEVFGTAHILDLVISEPASSEEQVNTSSICERNKSVDIFICPMCGQDFNIIGAFSEHNKREHNGKIVQLEMFNYNAGKAQLRPDAKEVSRMNKN